MKRTDNGTTEVWRAIGSTAEITATALLAAVSNLTAVGGELYFVSNNTTAPSLWRTVTGTAGNRTFRQMTSLPGTVVQAVAVNSRLYLAIDRTIGDAVNPTELWVSYTGADGMQITRYIRSFSGSITALTAMETVNYITLGSRTTERTARVDGILFLTVNAGSLGNQLWRILDNTEAYTARMLTSTLETLDSLTVVANTLYVRQNTNKILRVGATENAPRAYFTSATPLTGMTGSGGAVASAIAGSKCSTTGGGAGTSIGSST